MVIMHNKEFELLSKDSVIRSIIKFENDSDTHSFLNTLQYCWCLCVFKEDKISLMYRGMIKTEFVKEIDYCQISLIEISVCKRLSSCIVPRNYYHLDLTINLQDGERFHLESDFSGKLLLNILELAKNKHIAIEDKLELKNIVHTIFLDDLYNYFEMNFDRLAEEFELDNPRLDSRDKIQVESV